MSTNSDDKKKQTLPLGQQYHLLLKQPHLKFDSIELAMR